MPTLQLSSIAFSRGLAQGTIPLRDPVSMAELGAEPEWTAAGRSVAVAYPAGTTPRLEVRVVPAAPLPEGRVTLRLRATGSPLGVVDGSHTLQVGADGALPPVEARLSGAVGPGIGSTTLALQWEAALEDGPWRAIGASSHPVHVCWRRTLPASSWLSRSEQRAFPAAPTSPHWAYEPVMALTCQWAAGAGDAKAICDAILDGLQASDFQYAVGAWNVRDMLARRGGYCGGWYRMFQALAAAQGVKVERRSYLVDWRVEPQGESRWCALVVRAPGLNRQEPAEDASTFHDEDRGGLAPRVTTVTQRRYRFWGHPGRAADGHCINFLAHEGHWYLYDASFLPEAVRLDGFHLPPSDHRRSVPVEALGTFKAAYLDRAVDHMLGALRVGSHLYRTLHPDPDHPEFNSSEPVNGLTMRTAIIPDRDRQLTFIWTD